MLWRILGAGAIGVWGLYSIWNFSTLTAPPTCKVGEACILPGLTRRSSYLLHLYATQGPTTLARIGSQSPKLPGVGAIPAPGPSRGQDAPQWIGSIEEHYGEEASCTRPQGLKHHIPNGKLLVDPKPGLFQRLRGQACSRSVHWEIPEKWRHNSSVIFVSAVGTAVDDPTEIVLVQRSMPITLLRPREFKKGRRRHLLTPKPNYDDMPPEDELLLSVPKRVTIGPLLIDHEIDEKQFRAKRMGGFLQLQQDRETGDISYLSPVHIDTLISPRDEYLFLAEGAAPVIQLGISSTSWRKSAVQHILIGAIEMMEKKVGTSQYDSDSMKLLIAGESAGTLLATFIVSFLHLIFEFLALSASVVHFRSIDAAASQKTSKRSVILDAVFELAVLAWLRDEGEAKIVQFTILLRIVYDGWRYWILTRSGTKARASPKKSAKTLRKSPVPLWKFWEILRPSHLRAQRAQLGVDDFEYMALATLAWLICPLAIGMATYQLVFVPQQGWTSWIVKSAAMTSYIGGLVAMTPQLFRNFYFQSVEHLPWTTLTYQFTNTIIDDLFSCLIRMPKEHRISVFRDDVIFVIYWFQKRHYRNNPPPLADESNSLGAAPIAGQSFGQERDAEETSGKESASDEEGNSNSEESTEQEGIETELEQEEAGKTLPRRRRPW